MKDLGQADLARKREHAIEERKSSLPGPNGLFGITNEVQEKLANGLINENRVPINVKKRRNAHTPEEEFFARKLLHIEDLMNDHIREPEKFHRGGGIAAAEKGRHRLVDAGTILENSQRDGRIQIDPNGAGLQEGKSAEGMPAAGLTPDGHSDHASRAREFTSMALAIPPNERRVLASALVFTTGLQLDDFWQRRLFWYPRKNGPIASMSVSSILNDLTSVVLLNDPAPHLFAISAAHARCP